MTNYGMQQNPVFQGNGRVGRPCSIQHGILEKCNCLGKYWRKQKRELRGEFQSYLLFRCWQQVFLIVISGCSCPNLSSFTHSLLSLLLALMFEDHKLYPNVTYHCNTCCDMIPFLSHYSITASSLNNFSGNSTANRRLRLTTLISYLIAPADKSLPLAAIHYHNATRKGCANRHNPSLSYAQQPLFMRVTISIGYVRQPRRSSSCP